jgi:hypothetical protein
MSADLIFVAYRFEALPLISPQILQVAPDVRPVMHLLMK